MEENANPFADCVMKLLLVEYKKNNPAMSDENYQRELWTKIFNVNDAAMWGKNTKTEGSIAEIAVRKLNSLRSTFTNVVKKIVCEFML